MSNQRYPEEFKIEAVKQVTERGLPVAEVAARLGMSVHSLCIPPMLTPSSSDCDPPALEVLTRPFQCL